MNIVGTLRCCSRPLALVIALLGMAASANAESPDATDEAFGALLAMPGAQPKEGGWVIPQKAAEDENALIAQLQRLKKDGANFNAMRHRGTLLAHAIRAGKDRAAIWLLRNGADPKNVLFDGRADAYTLARKFQRAAVAAVLEEQYGYKAVQPAAPSSKPTTRHATNSEVPAVATTKEQQSINLLYELSGPVLQPNAQAQQAWRRHAATLSQEEFRSLFKDGNHLDRLVILTRHTDGGLEEALARLPVELVRRKAQMIADLLAEWSYVTYGEQQKIEYTGASRSWPALWRRLDQPLQYDKRADLAGRVPPSLWPGLFASGYSNHEAEVTGCLLAAVDLPGLKTLWPDFQRYFVNARDEAAGLVLGAYRIAQEKSPCYYASSPTDTAAKLAFLRANGVTGPVYGLRRPRPDKPMEPALAAMMNDFSPKEAVKPRLVSIAPNCKLALDERWWDALAKVRKVGWGVPPTSVQVIEAPGIDHCGLLVSGDSYPQWPGFSDDFDAGPSREPSMPRCADAPDDGEIWIMGGDGIHRVEVGVETRGMVSSLRQVRDNQTGKRYLLNAGQRGPLCALSHELPDAFEWQIDDKGPTLMPSRDDLLVVRLLRQQCQESEESHDVTCPDLERRDVPPSEGAAPLDRLRSADAVPLRELLDALGAGRRAAYRAAIANRDHAQLRRLLTTGVPAWWTAAEIKDLGKADLSLEEKRRRMALLFANADQLTEALRSDGYDLTESLATWLPRQDWTPILRILGKDPDAWFEMAQRLRASVEIDLACDIDRTQGFLCGGGVNLD
jgi:hypothetical protein